MGLASGFQRLKSFLSGSVERVPVGPRRAGTWDDGWTADWVPDRVSDRRFGRPDARERKEAPDARLTDDPQSQPPAVRLMEGRARNGSAGPRLLQRTDHERPDRQPHDKQGRSDMDMQGQGSLAAEGRLNGAAIPMGYRDGGEPEDLHPAAGEDAVSREPAGMRAPRPLATPVLAATPGGGGGKGPGAGAGGLGGGSGNGGGNGDGDGVGDDPPAPPGPPSPSGGSTSALNQQVVQAVQFSNTENLAYGMKMAVTPPEVMVGQTTGQAVQDAASYMNAIMQIAVAAQAIAIKKAAQGPVGEAEAVPLLAEIQGMVTAAVQVYGSVSTTAGQSAQTIFNDLKST